MFLLADMTTEKSYAEKQKVDYSRLHSLHLETIEHGLIVNWF